MVQTRFILVLGMFFASLTAAQTPAPRIVLVQEHVAAVTILPAVATPFPVRSFWLSHDFGKFNVRFSPISFAGAYRPEYSQQSFLPVDAVKTLFLTRSTLPLIRFWDGRIQLEAFQSTLRSPNAQPSAFGNSMRNFAAARQGCPCGSGSAHLSGLNLSFRLGRDARTGHSPQPWRGLTRAVTAVLN